MSKEQVMDYVMNSPANTNPNVLSGMLDGISGTQLPSPTESDNGRVLGVDGGEYKLVEQSGGTSLVTNKYELGEVTMEATKIGASLDLSQPIALSKIRALWVATARIDVVGGLVDYGGNLSADQVYQIIFQFVRGSESTHQTITFNPVVYITMEE